VDIDAEQVKLSIWYTAGQERVRTITAGRFHFHGLYCTVLYCTGKKWPGNLSGSRWFKFPFYLRWPLAFVSAVQTYFNTCSLPPAAIVQV